MFWKKYRTTIMCGAALAAASCAANPQNAIEPIVQPGNFSPALRLSTWTPPPGQDCAIVSGADSLPSVAELTDSVALHNAVSGYWSNPNAATGTALFSLRFDSIGSVIRNQILESSLEVDDQLSLMEMLADHVNAPPADRESRLHLKISASPTPEFRVGWSTTCLPAIANEAEIVSLLQRIGESIGREGGAVLDLWIAPTGRVSKVEIATTSGVSILDDYFTKVGRAMKFFPALLDRIPVGFVVRKAVNIEF